MSILNKYKRWKTNSLIDKSKYYDFVLSLDNAKTVDLNGELTKKCLISYINMNDSATTIYDKTVVSNPEYSFDDAINNGGILNNFAFTGTDNGLLLINSGITEEEYVTMLVDTVTEIVSGDTALTLFQVSGNTNNFTYDCHEDKDETESYYKFNGGFLQGVYKYPTIEYQTLPENIEGAWNLEFVLRPRTDYEHSGITINDVYSNNDGIFFYMGTRSENKFIEFYGCDFNELDSRIEYTGTTSYDVKTTDGHFAESDNIKDIITDNQYLIYNKTRDGYTTRTWNRGDLLKIQVKDNHFNGNLYEIMSRTNDGVTTKTLDDYIEKHKELTENKKCNYKEDLIDNAFALKINSDGSVSYRYLIRDCDNNSGFTVVSESTKENEVYSDQWNVINILFKIMNGNLDDCGKPVEQRTMKIYIYVNGYLKLVSRELPEFRFRELNEYSDKQEGVPFNISLGGGTQGLCESIWINRYYGSEKIFPLEKNFAGTFIGDIRSFKFYDCQLQYNEIKNNYLYEMNNNKEPKIIVSDKLIYYGFGTSEIDVIQNGKTMTINKDKMSRFTDVSEGESTNFYYIIANDYIGAKAEEFTCGGAPMVMVKDSRKIGNRPCTIFKSGAIYPNNTELSVIANNF